RLLDRLVRPISWDQSADSLEPLITREWVLTNGIGGYSSSTVAGVNTRRYHGLLVAALPNPLGRMVVLDRIDERLLLDNDQLVRLDGEERVDGGLRAAGARHLEDFHLEAGLPVWRYVVAGATIERRVVLIHEQNTVHVQYTLVDGEPPVHLALRPASHVR